jgi:hypothetical protein
VRVAAKVCAQLLIQSLDEVVKFIKNADDMMVMPVRR